MPDGLPARPPATPTARRLEASEASDAGVPQPQHAAGVDASCVDCRLPIREARLRAVPSAQRCLDCQRRHERAS